LALKYRRVVLVPERNPQDHEPLYLVITSNTALLREFGSTAVTPHVDLDSEVIVFVHRGYWPTGGYRIHIERLELLGSKMVVELATSDPGPDEFVTLVGTYPKDAVAVPRTKLGRPGPHLAVFKNGGTEVAVVPFAI